MCATALVEKSSSGPITHIRMCRAGVRNAVNRPAAEALARAFREFEADVKSRVAILHGEGEHFCAGADLSSVASGESSMMNRLEADGDGPMGPSRMQLSKPVIAAISGYCVAGGLELALWCDLRVADETAVFGVFCRRFGVPLIDGGTIRLPRLIGMSRAMDMILTGRPVDAREATQWGLVNRLVAKADLLTEAEKLALQIASFPQTCMRNDRRSAYAQWGMVETAAIANEFSLGMASLRTGEAASGAARFVGGSGRHGSREQE